MLSVFEWFVLALWCDAFVLTVLSDKPGQNQGRGLVNHKLVKAPLPHTVILLLAIPRRLFCFGSLVILDVVCRYLLLFLLYINIKIGKKYMLNVRLASDHLYGK